MGVGGLRRGGRAAGGQREAAERAADPDQKRKASLRLAPIARQPARAEATVVAHLQLEGGAQIVRVELEQILQRGRLLGRGGQQVYGGRLHGVRAARQTSTPRAGPRV